MDWKTDDVTMQFEAADIAENKMAAVCSYLGALVLVPLFAAKGSAFARFHANQGLVLFVAGLAYNLAAGMLAAIFFGISWVIYPVLMAVRLLELAFPVLAVWGAYHAACGRAKELPLVGKLRLLR